jgi:ArsR family transcriptional regulator
MPAAARKLWPLLQRELSGTELRADADKLKDVLAARQSGARWAERVAGEMERHYSPGRTWEATCRAFAGLLQLGDVLDVGSGDGAMAELIAGSARSIVCLDVSLPVEAAAAARLARFAHVRSVCADMHALPMRDESFDCVLLFNVLACSQEPARALSEAARVLRPGGTLALVTLDAHEHIAAAEAYGHVQSGFSPSALARMLRQAGLQVRSCEVACRERQSPRFSVVTAFARKPEALRGRKGRA